MLPSVGVGSAKDGGNGGVSVMDSTACIVDGAACTVDGTAPTKTAHQTFSPLKHFNKMRKTHRTHTVLPCVTNIGVYGNDAHR